jgi:muramoyltetrapeptide carboxypeptidase
MKIAITAPAGPVDQAKLSTGLKAMESFGFDEIVVGETCFSQVNWNSAQAEVRASELQRFWQDSTIDVVFAARGGFGCIHLLDLIDWTKMQKQQKILCGHSDLTVLHLAFMKFNMPFSVSGLMPAVEFSQSDLDGDSLQSFEQSLLGKCSIGERGAFPVKRGEAIGSLVPVTLSVLCSLIGSRYIPSLKGAILVIEDIGESPYRLDAYLSQLRLSGILSDLGGLIWGDFADCGEAEDLEHLLKKFSPLVNGPVAKGLSFGHCLPRISLPVGINVNFVVNEKVSIESVVLEC